MGRGTYLLILLLQLGGFLFIGGLVLGCLLGPHLTQLLGHVPNGDTWVVTLHLWTVLRAEDEEGRPVWHVGRHGYDITLWRVETNPAPPRQQHSRWTLGGVRILLSLASLGSFRRNVVLHFSLITSLVALRHVLEFGLLLRRHGLQETQRAPLLVPRPLCSTTSSATTPEKGAAGRPPHPPSLRALLGELGEVDGRARVLLLMLLPASLHEEGVGRRLPPWLVRILTHGSNSLRDAFRAPGSKEPVMSL